MTMRCGILIALAAAVLAQGAPVKVEEDWPNEEPKTRGQTVGGKAEGTWRRWYENGRMRSFTQYHLGKFHGIRREWHDNGQVMLDWTYSDGRPDKGVVTFLHGNGKVAHRFKSGGQNKHPNQTATWWHDNGAKQAEGKWRDELQHGKWTYWYRSGKRQRVVHYRKGQAHGWMTEWDEDGKVTKTLWENGKKQE